MEPANEAEHKPTLAEEMRKMEHEPLMPVEKRLITISLGLGVVLLALLWWVSSTFFSAH